MFVCISCFEPWFKIFTQDTLGNVMEHTSLYVNDYKIGGYNFLLGGYHSCSNQVLGDKSVSKTISQNIFCIMSLP